MAVDVVNNATEASSKRSQWADIAKGVCITLVVLWHVIMKHYLQISWHIGIPLPGVWGFLGDQLLPLRMPLFFTISGIFAVNAASRPWRSVVRSRVARFYYLYLVWFVIHTAVLAFVPNFDTLHAANGWDVLEELTITPINLWYLVALAVYFCIAKATRGVPRWIMLGSALILSIVDSAGWLATPGDRGGMYQNLIWFLLGFSFKPAVIRVANSATMRRLLLFGGVYVVLLGFMVVTKSQKWPGVWSVVSFSAIVFGLTGASMVSRLERVGTAIAKLGRNTLPIYITHMPLLGLFHLVLIGPLSHASRGVQLVVACVEPIVLTVALIALSLMLRDGLERVHMGWLYDLPTRKRPAPAADAEPPARHTAADPHAGYPSAGPAAGPSGGYTSAGASGGHTGVEGHTYAPTPVGNGVYSSRFSTASVPEPRATSDGLSWLTDSGDPVRIPGR
jgi:uncharacterized membrane protein YcfT